MQDFEIVDKAGAMLFRGKVEVNDIGVWSGDITENKAPDELNTLLRQVEECVDQQSFLAAEDLYGQMDKLELRLVFKGGPETPVTDLYTNQVGGISFRLPKYNPSPVPARD